MDRKLGELGNGIKEVVKDEYKKRLSESQVTEEGKQAVRINGGNCQEKKRSQIQETKNLRKEQQRISESYQKNKKQYYTNTCKDFKKRKEKKVKTSKRS